MTQAEEIAHLKKQLSEVLERLKEVLEQLSNAQERESQYLEQVSAMQAENHALNEQLAAAHKRIEELEKQKTPPPPFVKANVVKPRVQLLDMVDNSISPCELISGRFSPHSTEEIDEVFHPMDLCARTSFLPLFHAAFWTAPMGADTEEREVLRKSVIYC
jgi:regulator of replication initiation timing